MNRQKNKQSASKRVEKLERVMTRDVPLVMVEAWHRCFAESVPKVFGFPWPVPLFIFRDGAVESWRQTQRFHQELPTRTSRWIRKKLGNRKKFINALREYQRLAKKARTWKVKTVSPSTIAHQVLALSDDFTKGGAGLIPLFWFLQWNERSPVPLYDKEILDASLKARTNDRFMDDVTGLLFAYLGMLAKKQDWPLELVKFLRGEELAGAVKNPAKFPVRLLQERRQGYVYVDDAVRPLRELPRILRKKRYVLDEPLVVIKQGVLLGTVASTGKKRGRVTVVKTREQLTEVRKGDILVAPMTTPWYIPGMKKAVAFVTDEGGINSHAAIIAREMKKPCIVGTKIATKILKDGDLVEVDANEGTVRILKRHGRK